MYTVISHYLYEYNYTTGVSRSEITAEVVDHFLPSVLFHHYLPSYHQSSYGSSSTPLLTFLFTFICHTNMKTTNHF